MWQCCMYLGCLTSPCGFSVSSTAGGCCWWAAPEHAHMTGPEFPCYSHPASPLHPNQPEQSRSKRCKFSHMKALFNMLMLMCTNYFFGSKFSGVSLTMLKQGWHLGLKGFLKLYKYLLLTVICSGSSGRGLAWTQDVNHLLLHLLEDFLKLSVLQHQRPLTRLVVTEQGLVHLTFVAAESNLQTLYGYPIGDGTFDKCG